MALHFSSRIPTDSLAVLWDPGDKLCYSGSGNLFYNIANTTRFFEAYNSPTVDINSVEFDGSNDMLYYSANDDNQKVYYGAQRTISVCFRATTERGEGRIVSRPWNGSGQYNYQIIYNYNGGSPYVSISLLGDSSNSYGYNTPSFSLGETHVVTFAFGLTQIRIFLDGVLLTTANHGINTTTNQYGDWGGVTLGTLYPYGTGWGGNEGFSFGGKIYHFNVYTRALENSEVTSIHNNLIKRV
jgi:hypothetical protein